MAPEPELFKTDPRAASAHPPLHEALGPHPFVESEFEQGKGRCDRCGGGELAEIHQQKTDPLERIARALEGIERKDLVLPTATLIFALERIAGELGRMASDASARGGRNTEVLVWAVVAVISWVMGIVVGHAWK